LRFSTAVLSCAFAAACIAAPTSAADALSVTAMPSEFELTPGSAARGILVLANGGETTLRHVRVRYAGTRPSIRLELLNHKQTIPPHESVVLGFRITRVSEGSGKDVHIRLVTTYFERPANSSARGKHVTVSSLTIKPVANPMLLEAKIETNVEHINENRSGDGALVITNPRETKLQITEIQVRAPEDIKVALLCRRKTNGLVTADGKTRPFGQKQIRRCRGTATLPPRSQKILPARFSTLDSLAPGRRTVLIRVGAFDPSAVKSQTVLTSIPFTVDVFAESDILNALGIPIFLLLPGVIIVAVTWFLVRNVHPLKAQRSGDERANGGVSAAIDSAIGKTAGVAILGVAVSLLIAYLYPWLTRNIHPDQELDYLKAYAFRDFYYVFAYSFLFAFLSWLLFIVAFHLFQLLRWLFVLSPKDEPGDVLRKLGLSEPLGDVLRVLEVDTAFGKTRFARVSVDGSTETRALRLRRRKDMMLIGPTITIQLHASTLRTTLAREIEHCVQNDQAFRLWRKTRRAARQKEAERAYQARGSIPEPQLRSDVVPTSQEGPIVAISVRR
jgi:hypothetical protein